MRWQCVEAMSLAAHDLYCVLIKVMIGDAARLGVAAAIFALRGGVTGILARRMAGVGEMSLSRAIGLPRPA